MAAKAEHEVKNHPANKEKIRYEEPEVKKQLHPANHPACEERVESERKYAFDEGRSAGIKEAGGLKVKRREEEPRKEMEIMGGPGSIPEFLKKKEMEEPRMKKE